MKKSSVSTCQGVECLLSRDVYMTIDTRKKTVKKPFKIYFLASTSCALETEALAKSTGIYFDAAQGYSLIKRTWALLLSFKMQEG